MHYLCKVKKISMTSNVLPLHFAPRPAYAKVQTLTTSSCIVKSITWNLVNLSHLYSFIAELFATYFQNFSVCFQYILYTHCLKIFLSSVVSAFHYNSLKNNKRNLNMSVTWPHDICNPDYKSPKSSRQLCTAWLMKM